MRPLALRLIASPSALLALGLLLGSTQAANAQIVPQKPAQVKAANRRALRETRQTDSPYKDSHLGVTADQLKRGESTQPQPETNKSVNYRKGTAPNVKGPGFLGLRRRKKV
ncbi:hypothetical protein IC235_03870 [Hymenobacter sp. BT664]|uniref:Uncharacterized protein n=1 Tax=Hymenobacter montanus TaxID=2771359 RepID=A0A927BA96_9BACT|nr:hypothetical protein [Hymenobacter montanus]MBD2767030.1 hypothetical protein [Hymenobacter montanus]